MAQRNGMERIYTRIAFSLVLVANVACVAPDVAEPDPIDPAVSEAPLMTWADLTSRDLPQPDQTVRYGELDQQVIDIWIPEGSFSYHPVVLMVHGGCWQKSVADRTLMNYIADDLRSRGIAVWNIEYRGADEEGGGYTGTFDDVAAAADALAEYGSVYGLSNHQIVVFGHSAGGHLGAWLAARPRLPEGSPLASNSSASIKGVLNSGGLADLEISAPVTLPDCLASIQDALTGAPRADALSDTSPAEFQPANAMQISVNGARDRIAPPQLGKAYTNRVTSAGGLARYEEVPGGHVELISPGTEAWETEVDLLIELLGEVMDPPPPPFKTTYQVDTPKGFSAPSEKTGFSIDRRKMPGPLPQVQEVEITDQGLIEIHQTRMVTELKNAWADSEISFEGLNWFRLSKIEPDQIVMRFQYELELENQRITSRTIRVEIGDLASYGSTYTPMPPSPPTFDLRDR
ncbi:MAG: alpha/beta hydrolase [Pseudomonadota bacterium]